MALCVKKELVPTSVIRWNDKEGVEDNRPKPKSKFAAAVQSATGVGGGAAPQSAFASMIDRLKAAGASQNGEEPASPGSPGSPGSPASPERY